MEPILFYFKGTPLEGNNKFTLDFSNTKLVHHKNFSTDNDYYITTMNCNLVIANNLLDNIRVINKKLVVITKRTSISVRFIFN